MPDPTVPASAPAIHRRIAALSGRSRPVVSFRDRSTRTPRMERVMADKSPKKNTAKTTAAKSLKEKRAEKRAKHDKKG